MTVSNLTPSRVNAATPKRHSYTVHDKVRKGLCLRVAPSGRKTFEVNVMRKGARHKETIGDAAGMSPKEARVEYDRRLGEIAALDDIGPDTLFETMAKLAMNRKSRLWKPGTMRVNRSYFENHVLPHFRGRTISSINTIDVEAWFARLRSTPSTANRCANLLSVIMREAEAMGARPEGSNPVRGLRHYRLPKKGRVVTPEEMARLGAALETLKATDPLRAAMIRLICLTGCRRSEIQTLRWREYRNGHLYLEDSKTGPKTVFLSSHARAVLDGIKTPKSGLVFPAQRKSSKAISIGTFWSIFRRIPGLDDVRLHDLRHTYATTAIQLGENLTVIGTLLGHRNANTTLGYTHLDDEMMLEAVEVVGKAVSGTKGDEQ